ncbi:MAG: carbon-nitrogen hydrolase family protein [Tannerella sp.]|jgi:aliphatic nitrilase|nr:carbon-nitrogen hydrolase family protein [Tannerella sp.]
MNPKLTKFKAASIISSSGFDGKINGEATLQKAFDLIEQAAAQDVKLIAFPETFLPMFPWWAFMAVTYAKQNQLYAELYKNSYTADGPEIKKLAEYCKKYEMVMMMGMNEMVGYTLYNSQLYIDNGKILGVHRKMVPTGGERVIWARGAGDTSQVFDTTVGKLGGLICYEHSMPLARYALYSQGEQLHVSNFPGANFKSQPRDRNKTIDAIIRNVAFEGQVFVLNSTVTLNEIETKWYHELDPNTQGVLEPGGGIAAIINPACNYIGGPLEHQDGMVVADIDLEEILMAKFMIDSVGHYARPDLFHLIFNNRKEINMEIVDKIPGGITKEAAEYIRLLKNNLHKLQDEEMATAVEELAALFC